MKIELFTQVDPRWKNETMGNNLDSIGSYGCLLTSFANLTIPTAKTPLTPAMLNVFLKLNRGCLGLAKKDCPVNQQSLIIYDVIEYLLECKVNLSFTGEPVKTRNTFYIAKFVNSTGLTHFTNIIDYTKYNDEVMIFDVLTGRKEPFKRTDLSSIYQICFPPY